MKGTLKVNHTNKQIVMNATFEKYSEVCTRPEFKHLMEIKATFPDYTVVTEKMGTNTQKVTYEGLSTDFMRWYIKEFSSSDEIRTENLEKFDCAMDVVGNERGGYGKIKSWFLSKYPTIKVKGVTAELKTLHFDSTLKKESEEVESDTILQPTLAKTA